MAFKMKAGKEGPMKKNFPGAFKNTPTVSDGTNRYEATQDGIYVKGPGGKTAKYAVGDPGYDGAKQAYIEAGGTSPYNLGSSTGMSGAQGRPKMVKPGGVDIDGNYVTEGGRRTYTPASVGTVLGGTPNQMKSPKKMAKKSPKKIVKTNTRKSTMKLKKKSANKLNPGFDKLPKDVQAKIMKKKK